LSWEFSGVALKESGVCVLTVGGSSDLAGAESIKAEETGGDVCVIVSAIESCGMGNPESGEFGMYGGLEELGDNGEYGGVSGQLSVEESYEQE